MAVHRVPARRVGRWAVAVGVVVALATGSTVLLASSRPDATRRVASSSAEQDEHRMTCAARALAVSRRGPADLDLSCSDAVTALTPPQTFLAAGAATATTALPAGTTPGTLLVATVHTSAGSKVALTGWSLAYDVVSGPSGVRQSVWWTVAGATQQPPKATITPAAPVEMTTAGFLGADPTSPVTGAAGAAGSTPPPAAAGIAGGLRLLSLAARGAGGQVTPPAGAAPLATLVTDPGTLIAQATVRSDAPGAAPGRWNVPARSAAAVAGALSIRPAPAPGAGSRASVLAAGASRPFSCQNRLADYTRIDATTVDLACRAPGSTGIQAIGRAQTLTATSAGSARVALPVGTQVSDLLVTLVTTTQPTTVHFEPGWTAAYTVAGAKGVRLVAAWKWAAEGEQPATASLVPAGPVSVATLAFRNIDVHTPVEAASGAAGAASPAVVTKTAGGVLLLAQGGTAGAYVPVAPAGTQLAAATTGNTAAEVGAAVQAVKAAGSSPAKAWPSAPVAPAGAAGILALRPAVPGSTAQLGPRWVAGKSAQPASTTGSDPTVALGRAPDAPSPICGSSALNGPSSAPSGAVSVSPSQDLPGLVNARSGGTTFWLAPGTHRFGTGQYDQVTPKSGDTFIGAPGAVIDGQHKNLYAFTGNASGVTVSHLTIQNFGAAGDNNNQGVVNHDSGHDWTVSHNTIVANAGAGMMIGSGDQVIGNCFKNNGQYAFNAYSPDGVTSVVLAGNEIVGNNADDWEKRQPNCGCSGGGKFWATNGAKVTNNYVHDNRGVGLWADTNNANFLIQGNYIANNDDQGLMYETSYNANILNNTFVGNAYHAGAGNPGFPTGAIYISESGSDPRVPGPYSHTFRIAGNVFRDNWGGIVAWENADRFAGSPANSSTGTTTLVNPRTASEKACGTASLVAKAPYIDDCRWKTQNLLVEKNTFVLNRSSIPKCTVANACGFNALFSNYGSYPNWSPYQGTFVQKHIALGQNNVWRDNTYRGDWQFVIFSTGTSTSWAHWRGAPFLQDQGSTYN